MSDDFYEYKRYNQKVLYGTGYGKRYKKPENDLELAILRMKANGYNEKQIQETIKLAKLNSLASSTKRLLTTPAFNLKQLRKLTGPKWNETLDKLGKLVETWNDEKVPFLEKYQKEIQKISEGSETMEEKIKLYSLAAEKYQKEIEGIAKKNGDERSKVFKEYMKFKAEMIVKMWSRY